MSKQRDKKLFVSDMREAVERIVSYTEGYDLTRFREDEKTVDAVLRNFEILGEAAGQVPPDIQALAPEIEWRRIKDFRNVIAHFYIGVDLDLVWGVIENRLTGLRESVKRLESRLKPGT
jgi:uncharacterized protein with HEPN domain